MGLSLNASQWLGIVVFAGTALACAAAAWRQRVPWLGLALLMACLAAEVALGWRYRVHDLARAALARVGLEAMRGALQVALMVLVCAAALALLARGWARAEDDRAARLALLGGLAAALVFALESVSLHEVDVLIYAQAGAVRVIAWLWLLSTLPLWLALGLRLGQRRPAPRLNQHSSPARPGRRR